MGMRKGFKALVAEANEQIQTRTAEDAIRRVNEAGVVFVDIREPEELARDGKVPGALHAPRGMLEFYIDPESPYHKAEFASGKEILFYCASGLRSALAAKTARDMGLDKVAHVGGGFKAWREKSGPVEKVGG